MNAAVRDEPNDPKAKSDQTYYYQRNTLGLGHSERVTAYAVFVNMPLGRTGEKAKLFRGRVGKRLVSCSKASLDLNPRPKTYCSAVSAKKRLLPSPLSL